MSLQDQKQCKIFFILLLFCNPHEILQEVPVTRPDNGFWPRGLKIDPIFESKTNFLKEGKLTRQLSPKNAKRSFKYYVRGRP